VSCAEQPTREYSLMVELIGKAVLDGVEKDFSGGDYQENEFSLATVIPGKVRILDVGCGFGKWGFLIRDQFDVMLGFAYSKEKWKFDITGVEIFSDYITPVAEYIYNRVIEGDIFRCLDRLDRYDVVILGEILEHFPKDQGKRLISEMFCRTENIILSTPLGYYHQEESGGNPYQAHKSGWTLEDFRDHKIIEYRIVEDTLWKTLFSKAHLPVEFIKQVGDAKNIAMWLKK